MQRYTDHAGLLSQGSRYSLANPPDSLIQQLWAYDIATGEHIQLTGTQGAEETKPAYSREEELRRERSRTRETGVTDYEYAKNASAVFHFERGQWLTTGKAVFNMNPDEVIQHFKNQYERVPIS